MSKKIDIKKLIEENKKLRDMPDVGKAFVMYKKARYGKEDWNYRSVLVTLLVPADAARYKGEPYRTGKLRVSKAKVISITELSGSPLKKERRAKTFAIHSRGGSFYYKTGSVVKPVYDFAGPGMGTCASGIHGFLSKQAAQRY